MKTANSIRVKSGVVEVSEMMEPKKHEYFESGFSVDDLSRRQYDELLKNQDELIAFESSFVAVGNPEETIAMIKKVDLLNKMFDLVTAKNDIPIDGIYEVPKGLVYEIKQEMSAGWVPTYNNPDNSGLEPSAEIIDVAICSFAKEETYKLSRPVEGGELGTEMSYSPKEEKEEEPVFEENKIATIAQWVIDNRYPKSENDKISDFEMFTSICEKIQDLISKP